MTRVQTPRIFAASTFVAIAILAATPVLAQWQLESARSTVSFVSIKNGGVGEVHRFEKVMGYADPDGRIRLSIDLNSVETAVPIRNERVRDMLFDTADFPVATVTVSADRSLLAAVQRAARVISDADVTLALHGFERPLQVSVVTFPTTDGGFRIVTRDPVILNAMEFDLARGVEALRESVGLDSIATAVPVTVDLLFTPVSESE